MTTLHCARIALALTAVFALVTACTKEQAGVAGGTDTAMDTLVTAGWLARHLDDPDLVVLDCTVILNQDEQGNVRPLSGRSNYEAGHIPTAGFADLTGDLSDSDSPFQFAVPTPQRFAAVMGALGVGDDSRVVLYDSSGSMWAARVWWMLRWIGFDRAALLDGGLDAWTAGGRALSTGSAIRTARTLTPELRPELIADRDEVYAGIDNDAVQIIDVLPAAHFRGEMSMYGRPGHIPGAVNIPVFSLVGEDGRYKPNDELQAIFESDRDGRAITYCGGGIAASSNAFIMTRLGFTDVAVYTASLQEWAADSANPLEMASEADEPVIKD